MSFIAGYIAGLSDGGGSNIKDSITITKNGDYEPGKGYSDEYDGVKKINVKVKDMITKPLEINSTVSRTYSPEEYDCDAFSNVTANFNMFSQILALPLLYRWDIENSVFSVDVRAELNIDQMLSPFVQRVFVYSSGTVWGGTYMGCPYTILYKNNTPIVACKNTNYAYALYNIVSGQRTTTTWGRNASADPYLVDGNVLVIPVTYSMSNGETGTNVFRVKLPWALNDNFPIYTSKKLCDGDEPLLAIASQFFAETKIIPK